MDIDGTIYCPRCMRRLEAEQADGPCPWCGREPGEARPPMCLEPGTLLAGRYQLGEVIGRGGFGVTYAAWDETLGMPVAVKEYFPREDAARDTDETDELTPLPGHEAAFLDGLNRFRRESNLLATLQGIPCVVKVLDFFSENGTAYIAMEFVHGQPVDAWVREHGIRPRDLLGQLRPVFDALVRTHSQGVIHRDITPDNLLVREDGTFVLIDFGSAVEVERSAGTIVLTRRYAPVEQYGRDYGLQGPWTDVYGLAAVLYALTSGQEPVEAPLRAHRDEMKPLTRIKTGLRRYESAAITDALAVAPDKRTQSMAEFRARLYNLPLPEEIARRRRFMRRVIAAAAVLLALLGLLVANYTTGLPLGDGLLYSFAGDGVYIVRELNQKEERDLPESVLGVPVSGIRDGAFRGDRTLRRVSVPGTVRTVGDSAFYGCDHLEEAALAEGVEKIGLSAFGGCDAMVSLSVPASVTEIGEGAIPASAGDLTVWGERGSAAETCANERELRFTDPREISWSAENGTVTLTRIESEATVLRLPNVIGGLPVTAIGDGVRLKQVTVLWLPESLERVPDSLCEDARMLKEVRVGSHVREIGSRAFLYTGLESFAFPDSLRKIGDSAFSITLLETLSLPDGLEEIGREAFYGCMRFPSVRIPDSVKRIGDGAFQACMALEDVQLPSGLTEIGNSVFQGCRFRTLRVPSSVRRIGKSAFGESSLEWIHLPDGLEEIGSEAFTWCESLRYVGIPASCKAIAEDSFLYCTSAMVISAPGGSTAHRYALDHAIRYDDPGLWTEPGRWFGETAAYEAAVDLEPGAVVHAPLYNAEENCLITDVTASSNDLIAEIWLPPWQTEISTCAFMFAPNLQRIRTTGEIRVVGESAFADCESLTEFPFEHVERILPAAFMGCTSLPTPVFPDSLTEIGYNAFVGCGMIKEALLPPHLMRLAADCFTGTGVVIASIPANLRIVHESGLFDMCKSLQIVIVEEGVVSIGSALFRIGLPGDVDPDSAPCTVFLPSTLESLEDDWLGAWGTVSTLWVFNPELRFGPETFRPGQTDGLTVYGFAGSTAEAFAREHGLTFRTIREGGEMPSTETLVSICRDVSGTD
ncbi:MAG: leucine-rich repeat protein [Clostridia bacterium]|nr:leucine-rich repeat protein [Clostridia bacterium]